MALVDGGLQADRPGADFPAILKAQAGIELLQADREETHAQMM
jgi:hypothetical protein